jgi:hypothetical protein
VIDQDAATGASWPGASYYAQDHSLFKLSQELIEQYTGQPCLVDGNYSCPGWLEIENNPGVTSLVPGLAALYQLYGNGADSVYACGSSRCAWEQIGNGGTTQNVCR